MQKILQSIAYYIVFGSLYALSLLPLRVLYILSDFLYLFIYHVFGYRRKVVMQNLTQAFPEKTPEEKQIISKQFYHNFVDNFIETLKILSASESFISRHFVIENPECFNQFYHQGRRCQIHLGHVFNWELASMAAPFYTDYTFLAVYMPLESKLFDRLLKRLRTRTGAIFIPATNMRKSILPYRDMRYLLALVADQAPGNPANAYWLNLFGKAAAVVAGPEKGARAGNIPAVFVDIFKIRRGYYHARIELGSDNPSELAEGELTRLYVEFLERAISRHPSMYLWSHRRWKHGWKNEYKELWVGHDAPPEEPVITKYPD